jgi:hypothetical protein
MKSRMLLFIALLFSDSLCAQQKIVSNPYYVYQLNLFEKHFRGKIQIMSSFFTKGHSNLELDTMNYVSDNNGLFDAADTSKLNLDDMFEGIHFDYNSKSKSFVDYAGTVVKVFDTSYKYGQDSYIDENLFYPQLNLFIYKQNKNLDTSCIYITRQFNGERLIERITYYLGKRKKVSYESAFTYLQKISFSQMYKFTYKKVNAINKITEIKYFRTNEKTGKQFLYASNKYLYGMNNSIKKIVFAQFNGVTRVRGEIVFKYFPDQRL